jgi:hypothetical protein
MGCVDWIGLIWLNLAQWTAIVNEALNFLVAQNSGMVLSGCTTGGLPSSAQLRRVR